MREIRVARPDDAAELAALWGVCHPDSVWTRLGPRLATLYFLRFCRGSSELAVTAWLDGRLVGGCIGAVRPDLGRRRWYREQAAPLAAALARTTIDRPTALLSLIRRLVVALQRRFKLLRASRAGDDNTADHGCDDTSVCVMTDFFVSPSARGQKLGTLMLERFAAEMADRGFMWCQVHTTADNLASQIAQRRAGFECVARTGEDLTFLRQTRMDAEATR